MSNIAAAGGRLIGSLGYILAVLGRGSGPRGEKMAGRSRGTDSQDLATILDPFRVIFVDLGPDRQRSAVETEGMLAVGTGQCLASPGHFLASGTGPAAQNGQNRAQTPDQPPPAAAMLFFCCLLYTSPSPRDGLLSRMPSSA